MTELAVLGILIRGPLHGYEIKQIIQREMGDWTNIAFGSRKAWCWNWVLVRAILAWNGSKKQRIPLYLP